MEAYCSKSLQASLISSKFHLAIKVGMVAIVGCYYSPTTAMEDIICDIMEALNKVPDIKKVVFGGDFNVRPGSEEFKETSRVFNGKCLSLRSDPTKATLLCIFHVLEDLP